MKGLADTSLLNGANYSATTLHSAETDTSTALAAIIAVSAATCFFCAEVINLPTFPRTSPTMIQCVCVHPHVQHGEPTSQHDRESGRASDRIDRCGVGVELQACGSGARRLRASPMQPTAWEPDPAPSKEGRGKSWGEGPTFWAHEAVHRAHEADIPRHPGRCQALR